MTSFIWCYRKDANDMADQAVTTEKGFQLKVLGGLGLAIIVIMGISLSFLETTTLFSAGILLLAAMLIAIAYLALDL